jgi:predicted peptidase
MKYPFTTGLLVMLLVKSFTFAADAPASGKQVGVTFQSPTDATIKTNYLVFLPNDYGKADQKWPLLIFLHGAGECGDDLNLVKIHGPPKLVEQRPADFPFIVVSPQAEKPAIDAPLVERWETRPLSQLLDHLEATYSVDCGRVYLTGLSMGGFGTLRWAAHESHRFAAIMPICGGGWPHYGKYLKDVPTWIFHGDQDEGVPLRYSQEVAEAIRKAGGDPKLTIYEGVGHDSWTATYNNPEVYQWLLTHKLSDRKLPEKK